jgi:hypothetical protein
MWLWKVKNFWIPLPANNSQARLARYLTLILAYVILSVPDSITNLVHLIKDTNINTNIIFNYRLPRLAFLQVLPQDQTYTSHFRYSVVAITGISHLLSLFLFAHHQHARWQF